MAYTFTNSIADPVTAHAGSRETSTLFSGLRDSINHTHARAFNSVFVSQSYSGLGIVNGVATPSHLNWIANQKQPGTYSNLWIWRIPTISSAHNVVTVYVNARQTDNDANKLKKITFESSVASNAIAITSNSFVWHQIDLNVDTSSEFDTITAKLLTNHAGAAFELRSIVIRPKRLLSPLSAGLVTQPADRRSQTSTFEPIGADRTTAGRSISAALGEAIIDDLNALDRRIEPILSWSAFNSPDPGAQPQLRPLSRWYDAPIPAVARIRGSAKIVCHVRAHNPNQGSSPNDARPISFCIASPTIPGDLFSGWPSGANRKIVKSEEVPPNTTQWFTFTDTINREFGGPIDGVNPDRFIHCGILSTEQDQKFNRFNRLSPLGSNTARKRAQVNSIIIYMIP